MTPMWGQIWIVVIALAALAGWWLTLRPRASYSGAGGTMSILIILMAVLLCILAYNNKPRPLRALAIEQRPPAGTVHLPPRQP